MDSLSFLLRIGLFEYFDNYSSLLYTPRQPMINRTTNYYVRTSARVAVADLQETWLAARL